MRFLIPFARAQPNTTPLRNRNNSLTAWGISLSSALSAFEYSGRAGIMRPQPTLGFFQSRISGRSGFARTLRLGSGRFCAHLNASRPNGAQMSFGSPVQALVANSQGRAFGSSNMDVALDVKPTCRRWRQQDLL